MNTLHKDPKPLICGEGAESESELQEPDTTLGITEQSI